uniref:Peptidase S1 domain-containing protein n=1 Tax=Steinernema glaseri TaxID=37863 RepID=A0A1I8ATD0_9BILA
MRTAVLSLLLLACLEKAESQNLFIKSIKLGTSFRGIKHHAGQLKKEDPYYCALDWMNMNHKDIVGITFDTVNEVCTSYAEIHNLVNVKGEKEEAYLLVSGDNDQCHSDDNMKLLKSKAVCKKGWTRRTDFTNLCYRYMTVEEYAAVAQIGVKFLFLVITACTEHLINPW